VRRSFAPTELPGSRLAAGMRLALLSDLFSSIAPRNSLGSLFLDAVTNSPSLFLPLLFPPHAHLSPLLYRFHYFILLHRQRDISTTNSQHLSLAPHSLLFVDSFLLLLRCPQAKLCACNALSLLSLSEDFPEKILNPGGHLSAGSDGMRPVVDVITGIGQESDDVASSALSILNNACLNSKACADRILLSRAPIEVVQRMHVYRCDARAEGSSLLALLTQVGHAVPPFHTVLVLWV
jgi:hypothetical protein